MSGKSLCSPWVRVVALVPVFVILFGFAAYAAVTSEGDYRGTFIGDRYGSFVLEVSSDGYISGELFFNKTTTSVPLVGDCLPGGECQFSALDGTMVFRGHLDQFSRFIGKWIFNEGEERGSFYGMRQ